MAKILLVDDSTELLEVFTMIFTSNDFEVQTASDRKTLQQELSTFQPDVVLMDVMLGGLDGRELCKEIKQNNPDRKIAVILLSASPEVLKEYKKYGADDVIEKPFDINTIINKVDAVLGRSLPQ